MKKFDWRYSGWAIVLIIGFVLSHIFYCEILCFTKCILSFPDLNLYAGGVATIFTILHKIKTRKIVWNTKMSFKEFRASITDIISFIDNPIVIVGSLTLVKGLYLQSVEGVQYFPFLKGYEITFILLVTLYMLYSSLLELWTNFAETCWSDVVTKEKPEATPQEQTKDKVVPKPEE